MNLEEMTIEELRQYKVYLIGQIQELQAKTRKLDKLVKARLKDVQMVEKENC
jgi:hypothetical protein